MKEVEKEEVYTQPGEDFTIGNGGVIRMEKVNEMGKATWEEKMKQWDEEWERKLAELKPILPTPEEIEQMNQTKLFGWVMNIQSQLQTRKMMRHPLEELRTRIIHALKDNLLTEKEKESCILHAIVKSQDWHS